MKRTLVPIIIPNSENPYKKGDYIICLNGPWKGSHAIASTDSQRDYWQAQTVLLCDRGAEIKEMEWVYNSETGEVYQLHGASGKFNVRHKIIASTDKSHNVLPISKETLQLIADSKDNAVFECEMVPDMDYVGSNSNGADQYVQVGERYPTTNWFIDVKVKEEEQIIIPEEEKVYSQDYINHLNFKIEALEVIQCAYDFLLNKYPELKENKPPNNTGKILHAEEDMLTAEQWYNIKSDLKTEDGKAWVNYHQRTSFLAIPQEYGDYCANFQKQRSDKAMQLLSEINDYLNDEHPQGSRDARAINTIDTGSIFHKQIQELLKSK